MAVTNLKCRECATEYPLEALYVCERCFGPLEVVYDHSRSRRRRRRSCAGASRPARRTSGATPTSCRSLDGPPAPSGRLASRTGLPAGCTPLIRADRLAQRLGLREVWVKNDAANPTHSFKDRVVSVAAARARELGFETIACASTGNLANSVAAHGAALGLESYVFIPADLEEQKVLATGVYGTKLVAVKGNYDDVNRLCTELSAERDWAFVNINLRPYYAEGSKTLAYEIAEQLGFELPDRCVVPIASGSLFTKVGKGFAEWRELGSGRDPAPAAAHERRAGRGLLAGRLRVRRRPRRVPAGEAATRSPSRLRSATPPTAPTRSSSHAAPAAGVDASATRRSAPASRCSPRPPASSPRPPAGSRRRCSPSSPRAGTSTPTSASCS